MRLEEIMILLFSLCPVDINIQEARDAYFLSATSKTEAMHFQKMLDSVGEEATPVLVCYKGASVMLNAKYSANPFNKLALFKRGKRLIELSVARDTACLESRFIRFSVQRNLPGVLCYSENILQDSSMVAKGMTDMKDVDLKNKITAYFNTLKEGKNRK